MNNRFLQRAWFWAERNGYPLAARILFGALIARSTGPILLSDKEIRIVEQEKAARRLIRLKESGQLDVQSLESGRLPMVSIGVFACNRFDLLQKTAAALSAFLARYGGEFSHEVILFHDGENSEIEAWARANRLFDRVLFNRVNHGLSKNINRFWFEEARGKYILNVEEDQVCEFSHNFIKEAIDILDHDANVGCVRFGRWYPDDFRSWNKARKITMRILSEHVLSTPSGHQYRILEKTAYDNTAALHRFAALALTGRMRDEGIPRRSQEGEYLRRYNLLWQGARGIRFEDNPFLHIGEGRSCPTWQE